MTAKNDGIEHWWKCLCGKTERFVWGERLHVCMRCGSENGWRLHDALYGGHALCDKGKKTPIRSNPGDGLFDAPDYFGGGAAR